MRSAPPNLAARAAAAVTLAVCALTLPGCKSMPSYSMPSFSNPLAHRAEKRVVNGFATALAEADAERLATHSSQTFQSTALADEEAIEEVKRIWPASGKLEVVAVKDVPEDELREAGVAEKLVTVKDERGWKTDHRLVRDAGSRKWVVDDILITRTQRGLTATKTVSEQVMFISVVRDFARAWRSGDREQRLAGVTPACRAELEPLPDKVLDHLAGRMFPEDERDGTPEATMDDDIAIVRLDRRTSEVRLQMKRVDGTWLVDDAALGGSRDAETIPSLRKSAVAYAATAKFLDAYAAADRETLKSVATETFFDSTLKTADLSSLPLPTASAGETGQLKIVGEQAELVVEEGDRTVQIALVRQIDEKDPDAAAEFRVEDVTLYENGGAQRKRLASALIAEPLAQLYADALVARDVSHLRVMATRDFIDQVWDHVKSPDVAASLPLAEIRPGKREVLSVVHKGAATEVTMMQADRAMTFLLQEEAGAVKVDDVLLAVTDRPPSLKQTLAHFLPVARLRSALANADVAAVQRECSGDFNRLIWSQVRNVPPDAAAAVRFLDAPLGKLTPGTTEATIQLGDPDYGSVVTLLEDRGQWKIHDVTIVAGRGPGEQVALKPRLRDALANGTLFAAARPVRSADAGGLIQQVGYETPAAPEPAPLPMGREPRPLDLGAAPQLAPELQNRPAALPAGSSALPFTEPLIPSDSFGPPSPRSTEAPPL